MVPTSSGRTRCVSASEKQGHAPRRPGPEHRRSSAQPPRCKSEEMNPQADCTTTSSSPLPCKPAVFNCSLVTMDFVLKPETGSHSADKLPAQASARASESLNIILQRCQRRATCQQSRVSSADDSNRRANSELLPSSLIATTSTNLPARVLGLALNQHTDPGAHTCSGNTQRLASSSGNILRTDA